MKLREKEEDNHYTTLKTGDTKFPLRYTHSGLKKIIARAQKSLRATYNTRARERQSLVLRMLAMRPGSQNHNIPKEYPSRELITRHSAVGGVETKAETAKEREEHELLGHAVFCSWCRHCVNSSGYGSQHRTQEEDSLHRACTTMISLPQ